MADLRLKSTRPPAGDGAGLANSARAVLDTVLEDAGFLVRPEGSLFVVLHRPADRALSGLLTVCGSLFAERHTDYRREVRLARALACSGVAVARFHYRGVGNSDTGSASLDAFSRDALDVTLAATRSASVSRVAFLGIGMGSLIASRALLSNPDAPLLLWKPVLDGTRFFKDLFRARLVAATRSGRSRPVPTDELLAELTREGQVDVMGFTLAAGLYESLNGSQLAQTVPERSRPILVQPFKGGRSAGLERLVSDWRKRGFQVELQPVKLAEDPWFIPDGAEVAASILATEEQLIASTRDWLTGLWGSGQ
ncbi:MAG: serine aminopeptidase domain-containing protein [Solirubrobacteraceae bacterium]